MLTVVPEPASGDDDRSAASGSASLIDEIVREGARRILAEALLAEVDAYIARFAGERDENGRRLMVRNGHHRNASPVSCWSTRALVMRPIWTDCVAGVHTVRPYWPLGCGRVV